MGYYPSAHRDVCFPGSPTTACHVFMDLKMVTRMLQPDDVVSGGPFSPGGHLETPPALALAAQQPCEQSSGLSHGLHSVPGYWVDIWLVWLLPAWTQNKHLHSYQHETKVQEEVKVFQLCLPWWSILFPNTSHGYLCFSTSPCVELVALLLPSLSFLCFSFPFSRWVSTCFKFGSAALPDPCRVLWVIFLPVD